MRYTILIGVLFWGLLFLVAGCTKSDNRPTEVNCLSVAYNMIDRLSSYKKDAIRYSDYIRILSITKINSVDGISKNGQEYNVVEAIAEIEIIKECYWQQSFGLKVWTPSEYFSNGYKSKKSELIQPGSTFKFEEKFYFYKTEKGWRGEDNMIY